MGQFEVYEMMKDLKPICAMDVVKEHNISRFSASKTLARLEKAIDNIESYYQMERRGTIVYSVKYYRLTKRS